MILAHLGYFENRLSATVDIRVMANTSSFQRPIYLLTYKSKEGCDMVADWIVIYAVLFVLAAAVVGRVPADT
jgi:hypothetical protein